MTVTMNKDGIEWANPVEVPEFANAEIAFLAEGGKPYVLLSVDYKGQRYIRRLTMLEAKP